MGIERTNRFSAASQAPMLPGPSNGPCCRQCAGIVRVLIVLAVPGVAMFLPNLLY
jgi:hypothetical protein